MLSEILNTLTKGIDGLIGDLYVAASGEIKKRINKYYNLQKLKEIHENIHNVGKVKTIYNPDEIHNIKDVYIKNTACFEDGEEITDIDFFSAKKILIEGGPGQGKSLFMKYLCVTTSEKGKYIPIFLEFRKLNFKDNFNETLYDGISEFGIDVDKDMFEYIAKSNKIILILDGFDEIDSEYRNKYAIGLEKIAEKYDDLKIIVSSRPESGLSGSFYYKKFKILPLTLNKQISFIKDLYSNAANEDIIHLLKNSTFLKDVVTSPLLLTLFIITYKSTQCNPDNLSEFYSVIFPTMLYRHDRMKIGFERERESGLSDYKFQKIFESLCFILLADNKTRFSQNNFEDALNKSLKIENEASELENKIINDIVLITALIVKDGFNAYAYTHKSIQEYFSASYISRCPENLKIKFYTSVANDYKKYLHWQNVLFFLNVLDNYSYKKHYLIKVRKAILDYDNSHESLYIKFSKISEYISERSSFRADEDGNVSEFYWSDTYSSSVYKEFDAILKQGITEYIKHSKEKVADFLVTCSVAQYDRFKGIRDYFRIPIIEFIKHSKNQKSFSAYLTSYLYDSDFIKELESLNKSIVLYENMNDNLFDEI